MNRKAVIVVLLLITTVFSYGQYDDPEEHELLNDIKKNETITGTLFNTYMASSSINNKFINALLGNQFLDNNIKSSNNLSSMNQMGNMDDISLYYIHFPDSMLGTDVYGLKVSLSHRNIRNIKFTDDFYNLAFFGNKNYAGRSADISDMSFNYNQYQELQFGIFRKGSSESPLTYYVGLSILKGQTHHSFYTESAEIFTEETGEYVDFSLNGTYFASDSLKAKYGDFNGIGTSAHLYFDYFNTEKNYRLSLSVDNFGFITWNKNSFYIKADTIIHYDGLEINDVLNMVDNNMSGVSEDTLTKILYSEAESYNITRPLPERVQFRYLKYFKKYFFETGLVYVHDANFKMPLFYINNQYLIKDKILINLNTLYGGYSRLQTMLGVKASIGNHFRVSGSFNPTSFLIPEHTYSQNIFVSLSYRF